MTNVYFVRHAQPDILWKDDRTRPLTPLGVKDSKKVTERLIDMEIHAFFSSTYKRSIDTILDLARTLNMDIHTDDRLRERKSGEYGHNPGMLEKRWEDFDFCEDGGETLRSVQIRNIAALEQILDDFKDKSIVLGTHGTALSTIMNYFDNSFQCDGFKRIWLCMPYIVRIGFSQSKMIEKEELLMCERGYR